jgi:hypothetical protein
LTGDAERAFALAILEDVLGMKWELKCPDCQGYDPESYVVHDLVWAEAGLQPDGGCPPVLPVPEAGSTPSAGGLPRRSAGQ